MAKDNVRDRHRVEHDTRHRKLTRLHLSHGHCRRPPNTLWPGLVKDVYHDVLCTHSTEQVSFVQGASHYWGPLIPETQLRLATSHISSRQKGMQVGD